MRSPLLLLVVVPLSALAQHPLVQPPQSSQPSHSSGSHGFSAVTVQPPPAHGFSGVQPTFHGSSPVYQRPVYERPVYQQPIYQRPVYQRPIYREVYVAPPPPVYQQPVGTYCNVAPPPPCDACAVQQQVVETGTVYTGARAGVEYVAVPEARNPGGEFRRFELGYGMREVEDGVASHVHWLLDIRGGGIQGYYDRMADRQLLNTQLNLALAENDYGRIRGTLGATANWTPDVALIGPTAGLSATLKLGSMFVVDGYLDYTPWPFTDIDARAGVGVDLAILELSVGYRATYLDDQNRIDGEVAPQLLQGPYVGIAFVWPDFKS